MKRQYGEECFSSSWSTSVFWKLIIPAAISLCLARDAGTSKLEKVRFGWLSGLLVSRAAKLRRTKPAKAIKACRPSAAGHPAELWPSLLRMPARDIAIPVRPGMSLLVGGTGKGRRWLVARMAADRLGDVVARPALASRPNRAPGTRPDLCSADALSCGVLRHRRQSAIARRHCPLDISVEGDDNATPCETSINSRRQRALNRGGRRRPEVGARCRQ